MPLAAWMWMISPARAAEPAAAQALFNEGKQLMSAARYSDACPKLEESERLDPAIGTLYHLAECHEHVGKTASAWAEYLDVAAQAKRAVEPAREKVARERAARLEPKLARLSMTVAAADTPGLEVRRDGTLVGKAQWGTALPVDPGDHVIVASAPHKTPRQATVRAEAGRAVTFDVAALEDAPLPPSASGPTAPMTTSPPVDVSAAGAAGRDIAPPSDALASKPARAGLGPTRIAAIVLGSAGVVGVGLGTYFGVASKSKHDDADAHCAGNACDAAGVSLRSDALRDGNASTIAFALGAAALVGGAVVWLTAPPRSWRDARGHPRTGASVSVAALPGGLTLRGMF